MSDCSGAIQDSVQAAYAQRRPLAVSGGNTKRFYGREPQGEMLNVSDHRGVVRYEPAELVVTARCGTPLRELESVLAEHGQMLAFEPPHFGRGATLGGAVACGLSGPRRPYSGAVRDFVLGVTCVSGEGKRLRFGGEVVKNVAGFDAFRLMCGAMGTLGVLLDVSLKVLPRPEHTRTVVFECDTESALAAMNRWAGRALPVTASAYTQGRLHLRLEGTDAGVATAQNEIGGEVYGQGAAFWESLREQRLPYFEGDEPLWRLSVPPATPPLKIVGQWLMEWNGAQRWLRTRLPANIVRATAARAGGHAMLFRGGERDGNVFHPLPATVLKAHKALKQAFDPRGVLNPGRMYGGL